MADMIDTSEFRNGLKIEIDGEPFEIVFFQHVNDAQALFVMMESERTAGVQRTFSRMPERRMSEIVAERDRFNEVFVETQRFSDRTGDLRDFKRMDEARAVMIPLRRQEDLCFILQSPEGFAVDDPVTVSLKGRADVAFFFRHTAALRIRGIARIRAEKLLFQFFCFRSDQHRFSYA